MLLLGLIGQVLALRLLAVQLARTPDDPPLLRRIEPTMQRREQRGRRHRRLLRIAIVGFAVATAMTILGLVAILT